jgi:tungstate transport system ATP-binding protein
MTEPSPAVDTLSQVRQIYQNRTVLNIPTLTIHLGEVLAVVGPSGAGKSTLLRLLALLEGPAEGAVTLHTRERGVTYTTARIEDRRQLVMVFQRPALLSRSVYDNVAFGLQVRGDRNGDQRIRQALERVFLTDLAQAHPRTLSGGEAQQVALARALVLEPRVLILDEPTANLDPANVRIIEDLVREQHTRAGTTTIVVTHNIFQARRLATRVAFVLGGELIEDAPAEQFFEAPRDARTAAFISGDLVY